MSEKQQTYKRFNLWERIEHVILIVSFTTLGLTGLPQKYALEPISQYFIRLLGGIETIRVIHHIAAILFVVEAIYHLVVVGYKMYVKRKPATMIPGVKDGKDAIQWLGRNLGFVKEGPRMPRYNFMEKAEYLAMLWGFILMALTGFMLWNPIAVTKFLPGVVIPAAKAAHGGEAVLAVLAILLWHFYNVHLKQMNWSMIRGSLTRHEMEEEHGAELDDIEAGKMYVAPDSEIMRRRTTVFAPVAAVVTLALVGGLYFFVTFEESSLTTVPPAEQVQVFAPQTATPVPPTPTPEPTKIVEETDIDIDAGAEGGAEGGAEAALTWDGSISAMLEENCTACHGSLGDFNAETYDDTMKAVVPSDPDGSLIVEVQKAGGHPGQLSDEDLNKLIEWIQAGAPQ